MKHWRAGSSDALDRLTAAVYDQLRRLAERVMYGEGDGRTIDATALVHELYFRLPEVQHIDWQSRAQFLAVASRMMRNILVDHARKRRSAKRGGGAQEEIGEVPVIDSSLDVDVLHIHNALERFAAAYPRQARVVELRFFGGLTAEETAEVLQMQGVESSLRTVERDWRFAKAWLQNAI